MTTQKNVLITGAHGFLGKHVVSKLSKEPGFNIIAPTSVELNLLDHYDIDYYLEEYEPKIIVHLAATCGGIGANMNHPATFLYDNLIMTANLIDRFCEMNLDKFVGIGTVCSYPKYTPVPFKEDDLYNGYPEETNAPYGLAKRMQLEMLRAYRKQYGMNGIMLIPVNMYGEWDNFDDSSSHVIPAMMKKFHYAKIQGDSSVSLWGDGSASREFLYAGDCAEAIRLAVLNYDSPEPINIGTGKEITIKELAQIIQDIVGFEGTIEWATDMPNGQPRRCLDVSRAKERLGFEAKAELVPTLKRVYEWAKENEL